MEVLHLANITSADVGTWQIKLTAPPGLASQLVSATVFWQGAVRAIITANPPSVEARASRSASRSTCWARTGRSPTPRRSGACWWGSPPPATGCPARSRSRSPTPASGRLGERRRRLHGHLHRAEPAGHADVHRDRGRLRPVRHAGSRRRWRSARPAQGSPPRRQFPVVTSVQAGDSITGQRRSSPTRPAPPSTCGWSSARAARTPRSPARAGRSPSPSGNPPSVPVHGRLRQELARRLRLAPGQGGRAANPGQRLQRRPTLNVTVTKPPGFLAKYLWDIIGILVADHPGHPRRALAAARSAADRKDVRGLVAILRRDGEQLGRELAGAEQVVRRVPASSSATRLEPTARLDYPQAGVAPMYQVRRSGRGEVRLTTPTGLRAVRGRGRRARARHGHNGLELAFRDTRHPAGWDGRAAGLGRVGGRGSGAGSRSASRRRDWPARQPGGRLPARPDRRPAPRRPRLDVPHPVAAGTDSDASRPSVAEPVAVVRADSRRGGP